MKKMLKKTVALLLTLTLSLSLPIITTNAETIDVNTYEWEVLRLTNHERLQYGLQPLSLDPAIQGICNRREVEIASYFSHDMPDGTSAYITKLDNAGIAHSCCAENIAMGQESPQDVVTAWMNSPGHRANILHFALTHIGVGYNGRYETWVQVFTGTCDITSITVAQNGNGSYTLGTPIDKFSEYLVLNCRQHGQTVLPLDSAFCSGYNPYQTGRQTVTVTYQKQTPASSAVINHDGLLYNYRSANDIAYTTLTTTFTVSLFDPTTEQTTVPTTEPTTATTTEPTTATTTEPTTEPITEPESEPISEYPEETTTERIPEPSTEPTTEPSTEPPTEPTTEPTSEPTSEPPLKEPEVYDLRLPEKTKAGNIAMILALKIEGLKEIHLYDPDGALVTDAAQVVGTGCAIRCVFRDGQEAEYIVMVDGDINSDGKITAQDARLILRTSASLMIVSGVFEQAADINGDGRITASDARMTLRYAAGLIKDLNS